MKQMHWAQMVKVLKFHHARVIRCRHLHMDIHHVEIMVVNIIKDTFQMLNYVLNRIIDDGVRFVQHFSPRGVKNSRFIYPFQKS